MLYVNLQFNELTTAQHDSCSGVDVTAHLFLGPLCGRYLDNTSPTSMDFGRVNALLPDLFWPFRPHTSAEPSLRLTGRTRGSLWPWVRHLVHNVEPHVLES